MHVFVCFKFVLIEQLLSLQTSRNTQKIFFNFVLDVSVLEENNIFLRFFFDLSWIFSVYISL